MIKKWRTDVLAMTTSMSKRSGWHKKAAEHDEGVLPTNLSPAGVDIRTSYPCHVLFLRPSSFFSSSSRYFFRTTLTAYPIVCLTKSLWLPRTTVSSGCPKLEGPGEDFGGHGLRAR